MRVPTKIDFQYRRISQISDFTELIEVLFPSNRSQQHAAACIFFELKWAKHIVPNMAHIEKRYYISRRTLQRTRAKLATLGIIEHISHLNTRYGGQHGWRLSTRFERSLNQLGSKCADYRQAATGSREKEILLLDFTDARRRVPPSQKQHIPEQEKDGGEAF
jgi:hypothetical protein